jgi:hypothetical protein
MNLAQVRTVAKSLDMVQVPIGGTGMRVTLDAEIFYQPDRSGRAFAEHVPAADLHADDFGEALCVNHGGSTSNEDAAVRVLIGATPRVIDTTPCKPVDAGFEMFGSAVTH